ncbi:hypothetical protein [Chitinophaga sp. SYP-B3965]|uniref:hypothetical protein n=1 Tax=Chitinophaga sp. SYP-B3965 TaxID=2663120 RepID=UPI001C12BFE5|nr:hypothetical protein [Chitinophaga sp. SYP-B3965]
MNLKSTPNNLAKLEKIFEEAKYILRYEKGTFNSGYCILEHKKVVVVNKFLNMEGKINTLMDILPSITLEEGFLTPESQKMYRQIKDNRDAEDAADLAEDERRDAENAAAAEESSNAENAAAEASGDTEEPPATPAEEKPTETPE